MAGERVFLCPLTSEIHYVPWQVGCFGKQDDWSEWLVENYRPFPECTTSCNVSRTQCKMKMLGPMLKMGCCPPPRDFPLLCRPVLFIICIFLFTG